MVINELQVLMNNVPVRRLSKNQLGLMSFVYDASWLEHPARRPISLSLPLSPNPYKGEIVRNYFQNLLPDSETVLSCIQPSQPALSSDKKTDPLNDKKIDPLRKGGWAWFWQQAVA